MAEPDTSIALQQTWPESDVSLLPSALALFLPVKNEQNNEKRRNTMYFLTLLTISYSLLKNVTCRKASTNKNLCQ